MTFPDRPAAAAHPDTFTTPPKIAVASGPGTERPQVRGKSLFLGNEKLILRGVTYGPFRPDARGDVYGTPESVHDDFARMTARNINAVRSYTPPPRWLLDAAREHGLWVLVGLAWESHFDFFAERERPASIEARIRRNMRECACHPAVLGYTIGNEIPAPVVRWLGRARVERFLRRLALAVRAEDRGALITYVNYPTTEYLQLPFLDFVAFNVYLESRDRLKAYLARLQNLAGDRPLVMAEVGLDSRRNGERAQAEALRWQIQSAFDAGCAGAFVFSWTDEWHTGGQAVDDWDFGLTRRDRSPKPALDAVSEAYARVPFDPERRWPRITVAVCSHNGARTLRDCFGAIVRLDYPDFDVVVVDDGSIDGTASLAEEYGLRVIRSPQRGLSSARNTALEAATGPIIAYLDDDAFPDPHWLCYLAFAFETTDHAAVGGPNLPVPEDGLLADCVAHSPGGPIHVLLHDTLAEHIPGCNMAFRVDRLRTVGGFDPRFWTAGDDVDVCWRIQERGWTIGFHPAAFVWHHRRNSLRAYWKQQRGYGRAEALLERKWPEKYNAAGYPMWSGRLYGRDSGHGRVGRRTRIYQGVWGSAPFQSIYQSAAGGWYSLAQMGEWHLATGGLAGLAALGVLWPPLLVVLPGLALAAGLILAWAATGATAAVSACLDTPLRRRVAAWLIIVCLHLIQPWARLSGRVRLGLTPLRARRAKFRWPRPHKPRLWSETWRPAQDWLETVERRLKTRGEIVRRGGELDDWDLEIRDGVFGGARLRLLAEDHGSDRQLLRFAVWPRVPLTGWLTFAALAGMGLAAARTGSWLATAPIALIAFGVAVLVLRQVGGALDAALAGIGEVDTGSA